MNFTTQQLYEVFKKKISNQEKANMLNITLDEYMSLRDKIYDFQENQGEQINYVYVQELDNFINNKTTLTYYPTEPNPFKIIEINENVENGTKKITSYVTVEPKSAEEIIELLKIDTTQWKLSQYWNKEKSNGWEISAMITKLPEPKIDYKSCLKEVEIKTIPPYSFKIKSTLDPAAGVISLQDLHFGKVGNEDLRTNIISSLEYLLSKAVKNFKIEKLYLVLGGDILNVDTFNNTTTSGTPQENSMTATEMYIKAYEVMSEVIQLIKSSCEHLHIVYIPGNHDRLSSFHLLHALSQTFKNWKEISFDVEYSERKVKVYGQNMFCFEHGDVKGNNPLVYATEFPIEWGSTKFRTLYLGHLHFKKTREYVTGNEMHGFTTKIIPSLCSTDYWHYHKKYTGSKKSAVLELHDLTKGNVAEYVYTI